MAQTDIVQPTGSSPVEPPPSEMLIKDVLPVLIQCFGPILMGYISRRTGLLSSRDAKGLHVFVHYFSLPTLIFSSLATNNFEGIKWAFLACIFLSKVLIFIVVVALTMLLTSPVHTGKAGLYAIFATQSNDFALGYPLLQSIYSHHHKDYPKYLYLIAPIQLLIMNPIGLILIELYQQHEQTNGKRNIAIILLKRIITNPIILSTVAGIVGNYALHHHLPDMLDELIKVLGSAFSATALFLLGLSMTEDMKRSSFITVSLLVAAKLLIMPLVIQKLISQLAYNDKYHDIQSLEDFGFLYGTFPCAPTAFIFAKYYNIGVDVTAGGMVASTFLSVPLIIASASAISMSNYRTGSLQHHLMQTTIYTSVVSLVCCIWLVILFVIGRKWKKITHRTTLCLIVAQLFTSIGGMLWLVVNQNSKWTLYLQCIFSVGGIFASRIWTALLALLLVILHQRSLCFVLRIRFIVIFFGFGLSFILVIALVTGLLGDISESRSMDPNFQLGRIQTVVSFIIVLLSFILTVISLIIQQRYHTQQNEYQSIDITSDECETNYDHSYMTVTNCHCSKSQPPDLEDLGLSPSCISSCAQSHPPPVKNIRCNTNGESNNLQCTVISTSDPVNRSYQSEHTESVLNDMHNTSSLMQRHRDEQHYAVFCSDVKCHGQQCEHLVHKYEANQDAQESIEDGHQITSHVVLLLLMCLSMIVGVAICIWKLTTEKSTGIYDELEFLDVVMNYGQGIFTFVVFGMDPQLVVAPLKKIWRKIYYGTGEFSLPEVKNLSAETKNTCEQFLTYHYEKCVQALAQDIQLCSHSSDNSFYGSSLVDWLLAVGLAQDRKDAQNYGENLLLGRIIEAVEQRTFFKDDLQVYRFASV